MVTEIVKDGVLIEFLACVKREDEDDAIDFNYAVHLSPSFACGVFFTYIPVDGEVEEDGRIACDVDIHAGGDCIHPVDVMRAIKLAWDVHEENQHGKAYRVTNG